MATKINPILENKFNDTMTLRDYFAGQALAGLMSATNSDGTWTTEFAIDNAAKLAYKSADAMIAERNKQ